MSFFRLLRRERDVILGGRAIALGPLRFRLGGAWYRVGPFSLAAWHHYVGMREAAKGTLADDSDQIRALAPLVVCGPIKPRHLTQATPMQLAVLMAAVGIVNDMPYLDKQLESSGEEDGQRVSLADAVAFFCRTFPAYDLDKTLAMPAQAFYAFCESLGTQDGGEESYRDLTPEEYKKFAEKAAANA